jgi:hypothetical protein
MNTTKQRNKQNTTPTRSADTANRAQHLLQQALYKAKTEACAAEFARLNAHLLFHFVAGDVVVVVE